MVKEECSVSCQANIGFQVQILSIESYFFKLFLFSLFNYFFIFGGGRGASIYTLHITAVSASLAFHHELTDPAAGKPLYSQMRTVLENCS